MVHFPTKIANRLSLPTILTIPFIVQMITVMGIVGYLSFKNGQDTVNEITSKLRQELTTRILQQLEKTVDKPHTINEINANSLLQGDLDVLSGKGEHQLWQQFKVFPNTNLIYCSTEAEGAFLGVGRSEGGMGDAIHIQVENPETNHRFHYYQTDALGRRAELQMIDEYTYDPRSRPWYEAAKSQGQATWSEVYLDFQTLLPTITAATPIYRSDNGQLLGVCGTDIILSRELNTFLRNLQISESGIAFIMEPDGDLIASSTLDPIITGEGKDTRLLSARESQNKLIRGAATFLLNANDSLKNLTTSQTSFRLDNERHYIDSIRFTDNKGLDWIVVLVIPEADFMGEVYENTRTTILLCILALLVTVVLGALITRWLTKSLVQLSEDAQKLARGEWGLQIASDRKDIIGDLSRSFTLMAEQLQGSFSNLESRIEERTNELVKLNEELQRLADVDGLTQVANRRYFDITLEREWKRLARNCEPLSLILCDVDFFKKYNDHYGHQAGDLCLQKISAILQESIHRPTDLVARYGGEEFALILCNTPSEGAIKIAQHIHQLLAETAIPHEISKYGKITVSMGIATVIPNLGNHPRSLIKATDLALYAAKAQGKNCYYMARDLKLDELLASESPNCQTINTDEH